MKEFNPQKDCVKPTAALHAMDQHKIERQYPAYIGLDVHKNTIAWAVAKDGRQEPELFMKRRILSPEPFSVANSAKEPTWPGEIRAVFRPGRDLSWEQQRFLNANCQQMSNRAQRT